MSAGTEATASARTGVKRNVSKDLLNLARTPGGSPRTKGLPAPRASASRALRPAATAFVAALFAVIAFAGGDPTAVSITTPHYDPGRVPEHPDQLHRFRFAWTGIPVGEINVRLREDKDATGRRLLRVSASGKTNPVIDILWRYRMNAEGYVGLEPFGPGRFEADEQENKRRKLTTIEYEDGRIRSTRVKGDRTTRYDFEAGATLDLLATVTATLAMDYVIGDQYYFDVFTGTSRYLCTVEVEARETILAAGVERDSYRLGIITADLTDPAAEAKHRATQLWVSATRPRSLLRASVKTFIGSVHAELLAVVPGEAGEAPEHNRD